MPKRDLTMEIHLGGYSVIESKKLIPQVSPEWTQVRAVLQEDYRRIKNEGSDQHRRVLSALQEKYAVDYREFIPSNLPIESPLPHHTTINENWNCVNSDSLTCQLTWTEIESDLDIVTNAVEKGIVDANWAFARADTDLATADHYSQATILNLVSTNIVSRALMARKDGTATLTFYLADLVFQTSAHSWRTFRRVAGTFTAIGTDKTTPAPAANDILKIEVNGSTIRRLINGVENDSVTDTNITGNLRCGVGIYEDAGVVSPRLDDFEAADLVSFFQHSGPLRIYRKNRR